MLDHGYLLRFLEVVDEKLSHKITLIAVGGTALTLLNVKASTIDIDFTGPSRDIDEFDRIQQSMSHGIVIHMWSDGEVFSQRLPGDYMNRSIPINMQRDFVIKNIELRALHPIDIVATKIGRLNQRDLEDIETCLIHYEINKQDLLERTKKVKKSYIGNEYVYQMNLDTVIMAYGSLLR